MNHVCIGFSLGLVLTQTSNQKRNVWIDIINNFNTSSIKKWKAKVGLNRKKLENNVTFKLLAPNIGNNLKTNKK